MCARELCLYYFCPFKLTYSNVLVYLSKRVFSLSSTFYRASTLNQIQSYRIKLHIQIGFFRCCFIVLFLFWFFFSLPTTTKMSPPNWIHFKICLEKSHNIAGNSSSLSSSFLYLSFSHSLRWFFFCMFHVILALTFFFSLSKNWLELFCI